MQRKICFIYKCIDYLSGSYNKISVSQFEGKFLHGGEVTESGD